MSLISTPERMELNFYLASKETLRPVVRAFMNQLTAENWQRLETGRLDPETSTRVTALCVNVIEILAQSLHESLNRRLEKQKDWSPGSAKSVCKEDVRECLGNMGEVIAQTVAEVQGVGDIHYPKSGRVTELMVTAVTERVNSRLSKTSDSDDSEEHKTSPTILIKLRGHFKRILKNCYERMKTMLHRVKSTCTVQEKEEVVVPTQTSVTSLQEEKPGRAESTVNKSPTIFHVTKEILEQQLEEIVHDAQSYSTEEEDSLLLSQTSKDYELSELSSQIVENFTEDVPQDLAGCHTEDLLGYRRRKVIRQMRTVFVQTFARGSILSMMSKFRRKPASRKEQEAVKLVNSQLIKSVDDLLTEFITTNNQVPSRGSLEDCPFEKLASIFSGDELESFAEKLSDTLASHLTPPKVQEKTHREEIRAGVDKILKETRKWLKKQSRLRKIRKDCVSMTLKKFRRFVQNNQSDLSPPKTGAEDQTCPTPVREEVQSFTAEEEEEEACSDEEEEEEACSDEEEKEEVYTAEEQVEQAQVAKPSGQNTESVLKKWDPLICQIIVKMFLRKVMKNFFPDQTYKSAEARLTDMLYEKMSGTSVNVDLSLKSIKKKCKAVYKEVLKNVDASVLWLNLLEEDQPLLEAVAEALMKHFSSERPSSIQKFFRCLLRTFTSAWTPWASRLTAACRA
ncbi:uncharacterized protein LOC117808509 [Xyrichtys novacula]|uniref:Uncharacterized protein LOC117808509 n=1 Tax=Xyrichtys novacula TaxID=13765 RepID=A0AAV1FF60_XYRNO|nr:uncharacterized protein LOC117808509 [Xyrichtys novacula]CAJ1059347.1 uncharacterized protein LOC117808509 [Xyrichtys novacula]